MIMYMCLGIPVQHDELVIYLIQLNREEANLKEWQSYYLQQISELEKATK